MRHREILEGDRGQNKEVRGTKFKFGKFILRKIIKILLPPGRCDILRLNCTTLDFGGGRDRSAGASPQTPLWSSQRSPRSSS